MDSERFLFINGMEVDVDDEKDGNDSPKVGEKVS